ncbi:MAG TPA: serine hydrolase domain-containing protein, partial [Chitinophagales bacterium]|nr:serine hydrolase domain-containing protein [Chitinophagales bacterium]
MKSEQNAPFNSHYTTSLSTEKSPGLNHQGAQVQVVFVFAGVGFGRFGLSAPIETFLLRELRLKASYFITLRTGTDKHKIDNKFNTMKSKITAVLVSFLLLGSMSCQKDEPAIVTTKEELETALTNEVTSKNLTSISYCIVKNDTILYSNALGFADQSNNKLATDSTRYLIASISKTVTAVAIMQLVEQNLIGLDDDINQYLPFPVRNPSFPNDKITLRMLLSHRSSISDEFQETLTLDCYGTDCAMSLDQYFKAVFLNNGQYFSANNFSNSKPGLTEDYSNLGSALIGYLVERIS